MTFFGSSGTFRLSAILLVFTVYCVNRPTAGLDNGLALTPPMGWVSWARFTCNIDCNKYPDECISEKLYMDMADRMAADGWKELGYEYVNIDDCWSELERDSTTRKLIADKTRFPSGIKALADYVHSKGLKLGLYNDMGVKTCGGYPGLWTGDLSLFDIDAQTFADWEIDHLKVDGCYMNDTSQFDWLFPAFGQALAKTNRSILYSVEWPLYQYNQGIHPNYTAITNASNLIRNHDDIQDSWDSVTQTLAFYAKNQDEFISFQKPGAFFDPDMVVVGGFGLSPDQSQAQFAMWAMLSAPLYMSNDLRRISDWQKAILQNQNVINVNQDPLGIMARLVATKDNIDVYVKPMTDGKFAIAYLNRNQLGSGVYVSNALSDLIPADKLKRFILTDLYTGDRDVLEKTDSLELKVNPNGVSIVVLKPAQCCD